MLETSHDERTLAEVFSVTVGTVTLFHNCLESSDGARLRHWLKVPIQRRPT